MVAFGFFVGGFLFCFGWFVRICGFWCACNRLTFACLRVCVCFVILVCAIFWFGLTCIKNNFCHT